MSCKKLFHIPSYINVVKDLNTHTIINDLTPKLLNGCHIYFYPAKSKKPIFKIKSTKTHYLLYALLCILKFFVSRETIFIVKRSDLKIKTFHNRQNVSRETFYCLQLLNLN